MQNSSTPLVERVPFLAGVTFLGGYLDAYTYLTRGGVFANNHTANMAKLGITVAQGDFAGAMACLVPILGCVLGAFASELVRVCFPGHHDWRKRALILELLALLLVGFIPAAVPDAVVNTTLSFVTGFQLCLFRSCRWGAHNTTICTGNLRAVGQFLFGAIHQRTRDTVSRLVFYACLVFSFVVGSAVGVPICGLLGGLASWIGCIVSALLVAAIYMDERGTREKEAA